MAEKNRRDVRAAGRLRAARSDGFTLVETLVVLAIVSIMLTAVTPSFRSFSENRKLIAGGESIKSLALYARDTAMSEGEAYVIVFAFTEQAFWLAKASSLEYGDLAQTVGLGAYGPEALEATSEEEQAEALSARSRGVLGKSQPLVSGLTLARLDVSREGEIYTTDQEYGYVQFNVDGTAEPASAYLVNSKGNAVVVDVWRRASRVDSRKLTESEMSTLGLAG